MTTPIDWQPDLTDDYEDAAAPAVDTVRLSDEAQFAALFDDDETALAPRGAPSVTASKPPEAPAGKPSPAPLTTVPAPAEAPPEPVPEPAAEVPPAPSEAPATPPVRPAFGGLRLPLATPAEAPASPVTARQEVPQPVVENPFLDDEEDPEEVVAEAPKPWQEARETWAAKNPEAAAKDAERRARRAAKGKNVDAEASKIGRNNRRKSTIRKAKNLTQTDHEVMYFLGVCGIAYVSHVARIQRNTGFAVGRNATQRTATVTNRGVSIGTAEKRLRGLARLGMVRPIALGEGYSRAWMLTPRGRTHLQSEGVITRQEITVMERATAVDGHKKHHLAVAEVISERIWSQGGGIAPSYTDAVGVPHFIPDSRLRAEVQRVRSSLTVNSVSPSNEEVRAAVVDTLKKTGVTQEAVISNPAAMVVFEKNGPGIAYPDVVEYTRLADGSLRIRAIEVELTKKDAKEYRKKLAIYASPYQRALLAEVIYYVTADKDIEGAIKDTDAYRDLTQTGAISILPITDASGKPLRSQDVPGLDTRRRALGGAA